MVATGTSSAGFASRFGSCRDLVATGTISTGSASRFGNCWLASNSWAYQLDSGAYNSSRPNSNKCGRIAR